MKSETSTPPLSNSNGSKPYELIGALDQGTPSTKFALFDRSLRRLAGAIRQHQQIYPEAGWTEHDPMEILGHVKEVMKEAVEIASRKLGGRPISVQCVGITSQRETVVVWDRQSGKPLYNAIVWLDGRTHDLVNELSDTLGGQEAFREQTGLPIASYFSAVKLRWLMRNVPTVRDALESGTALWGTMDSWLVWNLTGGVDGGVHITDITNASRTLLMDLSEQEWSPSLVKAFCPAISMSTFPKICTSSECVGYLRNVGVELLEGVPITGLLGDQQCACVGHGLFEKGQTKCTYGTGASVLMVTGEEKVISSSGLLTTIAHKLGPNAPTVYALEGTIAIAGGALTWLRDNLEALQTPDEAEELLSSVEDTGGVFFVPAFAGLFAPRWRQDARGCIVGITQHTTRAHIVRALIESIGFQLQEIVQAMKEDVNVATRGIPIRVDGGLIHQAPTCLQISADITDCPIEQPESAELTLTGAAIAGGIGAGLWTLDDIRPFVSKVQRRWEPRMEEAVRRECLSRWSLAVERSIGWDDKSPVGSEGSPQTRGGGENGGSRPGGGSRSYTEFHLEAALAAPFTHRTLAEEDELPVVNETGISV